MMPNTYDRDRLVQAHGRDLQREAEHERLLAQLPHPERRVPRLPMQFKMFWRALCIRLQQGFQRRPA